MTSGYMVGVADLAVMLLAVWGYRHQCLLRDRARLMRDAIRHRDFSFRLPTKGLFFGERALQNALNDMGEDIERLVAHNEVESWQRLTRVLTHEIMNVMTPIQSISQAYLSDPDIKDSPYLDGIRAINDSSSGLALFVSNYRKMTQLQAPVLTDIDLDKLLRGVLALFPELRWEIDVPKGVTLRADESLLRQVFINIVKNAVEADASAIGVRYEVLSEKLMISNDGHVIPDDVAREIFIPFFTTKRRGSGIGLSLSRQILLTQGMVLRLAEHPRPGYNVTFVLEKERR